MRKILVGLSLALCLLLVAVNVLFVKVRALQKEPAPFAIDPKRFEEKCAAPPAWMAEQIQCDLAPYKEMGITRAMLDQGFFGFQRFNLVRFHVKGGHLSFTIDEKHLKGRHFRQLLGAFQTLNRLVKLPEVDFIVSLQDGFDEDAGLPPCPWLVFAKSLANKRCLLMPDFNALTGYARIRELVGQANQKHPWQTKMGRAFWRGSTTGGQLTADRWRHLPRAQLVLLSLWHPDDLDARFHHVVQCTPEVPALLHQLGMVSSSVSREGHLQYKYLVDVDGNSCSFERYFWLLLSNSLVFKQNSPNVQWYYRALEPYKHFVPIKQDLSDLMEKISWARQHDAEARMIAEQASRFVEENLSNEDILVYLRLLLEEYARLERF